MDKANRDIAARRCTINGTNRKVHARRLHTARDAAVTAGIWARRANRRPRTLRDDAGTLRNLRQPRKRRMGSTRAFGARGTALRQSPVHGVYAQHAWYFMAAVSNSYPIACVSRHSECQPTVASSRIPCSPRGSKLWFCQHGNEACRGLHFSRILYNDQRMQINLRRPNPQRRKRGENIRGNAPSPDVW